MYKNCKYLKKIYIAQIPATSAASSNGIFAAATNSTTGK
jgi:hypothetical protein